MAKRYFFRAGFSKQALILAQRVSFLQGCPSPKAAWGKSGVASSSKGSDWIRPVFAHPFPLNSGAPIASGNFMATYGDALSYTLIMDLAQLMGAPLFKTNGWTQFNCFSSQTLCMWKGGSKRQSCVDTFHTIWALSNFAGRGGYATFLRDAPLGAPVIYTMRYITASLLLKTYKEVLLIQAVLTSLNISKTLHLLKSFYHISKFWIVPYCRVTVHSHSSLPQTQSLFVNSDQNWNDNFLY